MCVCSLGLVGKEDAAADPFVELGYMRANQAYHLAKAHVPLNAADARAAKLAMGLALMNYQPRTDETIKGALAAFEDLVATGVDDEATIAARYFIARIWQMHAEPADPRLARSLYLALARKHPTHRLAQYAWVKIGTMDLYLDHSPDAKARIRRVEGYLDKLSDPAVRRSLRHVLGQACQVLVDDPERALTHYEAALADGIAKDNLLADVMLRAAECARRVGDAGKARSYLNSYLERYPRSHASQLAREILASLP
jgi:TolA-binding protein